MLNSEGFNLWADGYDKSVELSDEEGAYPFAGYEEILEKIYHRALSCVNKNVLDIGFGTGTLAVKLYAQGCRIFGQDFSEKMIAQAQEKMPEAKLCQGDFSLGLAVELKRHQYGAIIATYSLHHLSDAQKVCFLESLLPLLEDGGCIYIGDVAFQTRQELEQCKVQAGDEWDGEECYFVFEEIKKSFPKMTFEQVSHCAGLMTLGK